jgi:hypothetical protein
MTELTTLPVALSWLSMTADDANSTVARLITAISAQIQQFVSYQFSSQDYNKFFNGRNTQSISLPDYPITAVTLVAIWGRSIPARVNRNPGFVHDSKRVMVDKPWCFEKGLQNIRVMYTAGYATIPPDVEQAALMWLKATYDALDIGANVRRYEAGGTRVEYSNTSAVGGGYIIPMPPQVWAILQPFQRVTPV